MPAYTTCPACGFSGAHGFTSSIMGALRFYHDSNNCPGFYTWEGKEYTSLSELFEKKIVPLAKKRAYDETEAMLWIGGQRANIAGNFKKGAKLLKQWHAYAAKH